MDSTKAVLQSGNEPIKKVEPDGTELNAALVKKWNGPEHPQTPAVSEGAAALVRDTLAAFRMSH